MYFLNYDDVDPNKLRKNDLIFNFFDNDCNRGRRKGIRYCQKINSSNPHI